MGDEDVNLLGKYVNTVNEIRRLCWLLLRVVEINAEKTKRTKL